MYRSEEIMDDKDRSRDTGRDRDRSRRGDRPSRFSEGSVRDRSADRGNDRGGRKSSNCRVYVSNISYEYRWQDLKDLFRENVGDVSFVELFVDDNDKPKGCGIVEFSDPSLVKKCMEVMHRFDLKGRKLVIKEDFNNERDKYGNIINGRKNRDRDRHVDRDFDDRDNRRGGNWDSPPSLLSTMLPRNVGPQEQAEFKWGNTYGLSPQFLESLNIHRPLVNRVFVANLDYKVDEKKLREIFKLCGKVIDVELYHDKEGNSRGFAVVEFDHPVESVQAISMLHNQLLYDRPMTVRMDRIDHDSPLKLPDGLKGVGMGLGLNGEPLRDVSRNLPSSGNGCASSAGNAAGNTGPGILGAVPNPASLQALQGTAAALSSVVGNSTLAGLQASLGGVQTPFLAQLGNSLTGNLTSSMSNLNSNLGNNLSSSLSGNLGGNLGGNMGSNLGGNMGGNLGGNLGSNISDLASLNPNISSSLGNLSNSLLMGNSNNRMERDYRNESSNNFLMGGSGPGSVGGNSGAGDQIRSLQSLSGGNREYTSSNRDYDVSSGRNYDMKSEQDTFRHLSQNLGQSLGQSSVYSTVNNGSQSRTAQNISNSRGNGFSDTIIISNLPISATWKMLKEKFSAAGDVQFVEMKTKDTAIIRYASEWQAERAIKLMDRTRIDGRTLDVRFCY